MVSLTVEFEDCDSGNQYSVIDGKALKTPPDEGSLHLLYPSMYLLILFVNFRLSKIVLNSVSSV